MKISSKENIIITTDRNLSLKKITTSGTLGMETSFTKEDQSKVDINALAKGFRDTLYAQEPYANMNKDEIKQFNKIIRVMAEGLVETTFDVIEYLPNNDGKQGFSTAALNWANNLRSSAQGLPQLSAPRDNKQFVAEFKKNLTGLYRATGKAQTYINNAVLKVGKAIERDGASIPDKELVEKIKDVISVEDINWLNKSYVNSVSGWLPTKVETIVNRFYINKVKLRNINSDLISKSKTNKQLLNKLKQAQRVLNKIGTLPNRTDVLSLIN